ncbi:MAG TPA: sulfite exporter TauE/SafE family protein [Candidatus Limnocylindria bacterium]
MTSADAARRDEFTNISFGWTLARPSSGGVLNGLSGLRQAHVNEEAGLPSARRTPQAGGGGLMHLVVGGLIGLAGGVLSGLFGIGGGVVIVPLLVLLAGLTAKQAAGTSLAALLLPVGVLGVMEYWRAGYIDVRLAVVLAIGILIGAFLGARLAIGLPNEVIQRAFGVLLVLIGLRLALVVSG